MGLDLTLGARRPIPPRGNDRMAVALLLSLGIGVLTRERAAAIAALPKPEWITLPEAAEHTGLSVGFLRRLITAGKLRAVRDRAIKVKRSDLDNLEGIAELATSAKKLDETRDDLRRVVRSRRA